SVNQSGRSGSRRHFPCPPEEVGMSNVERPGPPFPGTGPLVRDAVPAPRGDFSDRRDLADLLDGEPLEFGEGSTGSSLTESGREADFLRSLRAAIRESKREAQGEKREPEEEQPGLQILAVAQQPFWSGLPTPADALSPTTEKGPSSIESVVTSVT